MQELSNKELLHKECLWGGDADQDQGQTRMAHVSHIHYTNKNLNKS